MFLGLILHRCFLKICRVAQLLSCVADMQEMLGNQYFMSRQYQKAIGALEAALTADKSNKGIRRKLIICYSQTGKLQKAMDTFLSLVKMDVDFIINTDPVDDDCPCPELVYEMEKKLDNNKDSLDFLLITAMLWLYCNLEKSILFFEKANKLDPQNSFVKSVLAFLTARQQQA